MPYRFAHAARYCTIADFTGSMIHISRNELFGCFAAVWRLVLRFFGESHEVFFGYTLLLYLFYFKNALRSRILLNHGKNVVQTLILLQSWSQFYDMRP